MKSVWGLHKISIIVKIDGIYTNSIKGLQSSMNCTNFEWKSARKHAGPSNCIKKRSGTNEIAKKDHFYLGRHLGHNICNDLLWLWIGSRNFWLHLVADIASFSSRLAKKQEQNSKNYAKFLKKIPNLSLYWYIATRSFFGTDAAINPKGSYYLDSDALIYVSDVLFCIEDI